MSRQKLKAAVGLLAGHTAPKAQIFKLGPTAAGMPTVWGWKRRSAHTYCKSVSGTGMQKIQNLGWYVLTLKGLDNTRVNGLIRLAASARFGVIA